MSHCVLNIGGSRFLVSFTEASQIMETLDRSPQVKPFWEGESGDKRSHSIADYNYSLEINQLVGDLVTLEELKEIKAKAEAEKEAAVKAEIAD